MTKQDHVSHRIFIYVTPVISVLLVVLNVITIYVFCKKFRLASLSLVLLVNICICDIVVCLVSNNFYVANLFHPTYNWSTGPIACKLFKTFTMMMNLSQILSLVVVCLDRMRRQTQINSKQWTKTTAIPFLAIIWFMSVAIAGPRMFLFDEKKIEKFSPETNVTTVVGLDCKPISINDTMFEVMIITQFVIGFAIPCICVLLTTIISQIFTTRLRKMMKRSNLNAPSSLMMNKQLALTFNLTCLLFLIVWTPFFVLSIYDLQQNLLVKKNLADMNFTLRCTLLVLGSGKPFIYLLGLKKFRGAVCALCSSQKDIIYKEQTSSSSFSVWSTSSSTERHGNGSSPN